MDQLKIGIVGYGKMGKIREQSIIASEEAKLVAVYEVSNKQNSSNNIIHCKSYTELLEADVDAIPPKDAFAPGSIGKKTPSSLKYSFRSSLVTFA